MADVSVKMGISGVQQFKQGLKQAQDSVKTIDAALKKNEAQFKKTGDAQAYMGQKTDLLKQKLTSQKTAAANASQALAQMVKDGVDPASASYQKLAQSLLDAETAAIETETQLQTLGREEDKAGESTDRLEQSLQGLNKKVSLKQVIDGIGSITSGLEKAAKKAVEVGEKIWDNIMDSAAYADDTATLAQRMGLTTTEVQQMQYVANRFEAPVETVAKSWKKLKNNMASDSDEIAGAFSQIGVSIYDITGYGKYGDPIKKARDFKDVFWEVGDALMRIEDESMQEAMAQKLLGRSWDELIPLFTAGREAYEDALAAAPTNSEDAIQNAAELNAKVEELEQSFRVLKTEVIGNIAPALSAAADSLEKLITSVTEYLKTDEGQKLLKNMGEAVEGLFSDLSKIDPEAVVQGFSDVFTKIVEGLEWLVNNKDTVIGALEGIVLGWAGLKITGGVLKIIELVNGLKTLGGADGVTRALEQIGSGGGTEGTAGTAGTAGGTAGKMGIGAWLTDALGMSGTGLLGGAAASAAIVYFGSKVIADINDEANKMREVAADAERYSNFGKEQANYAWGGMDNRYVLESYVNSLMKTTGDTRGINSPENILTRMAGGLGGDILDVFEYTNTSGEKRNKLIDMLNMDAQNAAVAAMMLHAAGISTSDIDYSEQYGKYQELVSNGSMGYSTALTTLRDFFNASGTRENGRWTIPGFTNTNGVMPVINGVPLANMSGYVMTSDENKRQYEGTWDPEELNQKTEDLEGSFSGVSETTTTTREDIEHLGDEADKAKDHVSKMGELAGGAEGEVQDLGTAAGAAAAQLASIKAPDLSGFMPWGHANGLPYVPFDGYMAMLHRGERVLTARENQNYTTNNTYFGTVNLNNNLEIEALTESIDRRNRRQQAGYGA